MSVGFNGMNNLGQYSAKDVQILAKYGVGATLVEVSDSPFSAAALPFIGVMGIQQVWPWLKENRRGVVENGNWFQNWGQAIKDFNNRGNKEGGTKAMRKIRAAAGIADPKEGYRALTSRAAYAEGLQQYRLAKILESIPDETKLAKIVSEEVVDGKNIKTVITGLYNDASAAAKAGNLEAAEEALAKANNLAHGKIPGFFGKFGKFVGNYTGYSPVSGWFKKLAASGESPLMRKILPCMKGVGGFAILTGVAEAFQIIPTFFELGIGSGLKQTGKSIVKGAASIGGWFGGEAAGVMAGEVIGTVIFPGVGTAAGAVIGGLLGIVGGFIGSWAAGKVAEKVVGKNELDLDKEKKAQQLAKQAMVDPSTMQAMFGKVSERLQSEGDSEDTRLAFKSLKNLGVDVSSPQAANQTQVAQSAPSFKGNPYAMQYQYSNSAPNPVTAQLLQSAINPTENIMDMDLMNPFNNLNPALS